MGKVGKLNKINTDFISGPIVRMNFRIISTGERSRTSMESYVHCALCIPNDVVFYRKLAKKSSNGYCAKTPINIVLISRRVRDDYDETFSIKTFSGSSPSPMTLPFCYGTMPKSAEVGPRKKQARCQWLVGLRV